MLELAYIWLDGVVHFFLWRIFFHQQHSVSRRPLVLPCWPTRQLFGEDEDATGELDEAEKQGQNGTLSISYH